MAFQIRAVTGNRRLRPSRLAEINALKGRLFERKQIEKAEQFQRQQFDLQRQNLAQAKKAEKKRMGIAAGELGVNLMLNAPDTSALDIGLKIPKLRGALLGSSPATSTQIDPSGAKQYTLGKGSNAHNLSRGLLGGATLGTTLGAGLAGFGVSRFVDEDKKLLKAGLGAGVGALTGGFTGGGDLYSAAIGGLFGGLGGLF
ncbi:MAG: hypothetical protein ACE5HX_04230 [bacterium]